MRSIFLLSFYLATPALADCPTADDLSGKGVRFFNEGGDSEVFQRREDGFILSVFHGTDSKTHSLLEKGVYLVESVTVEKDGSKSRLKYQMPTSYDNLPEPFHMGGFSMVLEGEDSVGRFKERQSYQFGSAGVLMIDGCAFDYVPVHVTYGDDPAQEVYTYIPKLGLSYFSAAIDANGKETAYPYNQVEVLQ